MKDDEILEIARSVEGGEWKAVDPAIVKKILKLGRAIIKRKNMGHKQKECTTCNRKVWDYKASECSHVACALRKQITAAPPEDDTAFASSVFHGTIRRTIEDEN